MNLDRVKTNANLGANYARAKPVMIKQSAALFYEFEGLSATETFCSLPAGVWKCVLLSGSGKKCMKMATSPSMRGTFG